MFRSLRLGFATNSSSTHSVILHSKLHDKSGIIDTGFDVDGDGYADQNFTLVAPDSKLKFLALANLKHGEQMSSHDIIEAHSVLRDVAPKCGLDAGSVLEEIKNLEVPNGTHDATCPKGVDMATWFDYFLSEDVVVYGYYDNNEAPYLRSNVDVRGLEFSSYNTRWKQDGKALVSYDTRSGHKTRWSPEPYLKSTTPELVDVKITDYCGYGCKFCYQGSTKRGQHARLEDLEMIFDQLRDMDCFEIAVGGGEPAHHPEFAKIIEMAKARKLTFNFTAYGIDWTQSKEVTDALRENKWGGSGFGVGLSVHKAADLVKVKAATRNLEEINLRTQIIAQTVIGATPIKTSMELMEVCNDEQIPLILLGFKRTGRGEEFKVSNAERDDVKRLVERAQGFVEDDELLGGQRFHLSVDTAFLDLYGDILDEMGVPQILRTSPEGAFSMYVDAVEMTAGPSSYCDKSLMQPVGDLKAQFAGF